MIGSLPVSLEINGTNYPINDDYRVALTLFEAYEDQSLTTQEKAIVTLMCLYEDWEKIPRSDWEDAVTKAFWFLNGGDMPMTDYQVKTYDWKQDEKMIFSSVNAVAHCEVRALDHLHWWTFLGYFSEAGEGLLSTVMHLRWKKAKGKPLDKVETEFYRDHASLIDLDRVLSPEEQAEEDFVDSLFENATERG